MTCCQFSILYRHVMRINIKGLLLSKPVHRTAIIRQVVCQLLLHSRKQWGGKGLNCIRRKVGLHQDGITLSHIGEVDCHLTGWYIWRSRVERCECGAIYSANICSTVGSQRQTFASRHKWAMVYDTQNSQLRAGLQFVKRMDFESNSADSARRQ